MRQYDSTPTNGESRWAAAGSSAGETRPGGPPDYDRIAEPGTTGPGGGRSATADAGTPATAALAASLADERAKTEGMKAENGTTGSSRPPSGGLTAASGFDAAEASPEPFPPLPPEDGTVGGAAASGFDAAEASPEPLPPEDGTVGGAAVTPGEVRLALDELAETTEKAERAVTYIVERDPAATEAVPVLADIADLAEFQKGLLARESAATRQASDLFVEVANDALPCLEGYPQRPIQDARLAAARAVESTAGLFR